MIAHSPESPDVQDVLSLRQGLRGVIKATNFWKTARRPGAALLREAFKPLLPLMGLHEPDAGFAKRDLKRLEVYSDQTDSTPLASYLGDLAGGRGGRSSRSSRLDQRDAVDISDEDADDGVATGAGAEALSRSGVAASVVRTPVSRRKEEQRPILLDIEALRRLIASNRSGVDAIRAGSRPSRRSSSVSREPSRRRGTRGSPSPSSSSSSSTSRDS